MNAIFRWAFARSLSRVCGVGMTVSLIALSNANAQTARVPSSTEKAAVDALIPWLLQEDAQLRGIPFSEVIFDSTGKHVLACDFPKTAAGGKQRSGYPDLELVDQLSHRIYYLDPKLYAVGSRDSSFRTFYFEPKIATNKVREDAVHFIVGFEHEKPAANRRWKFTRWDLVDLSHFQVKLKAEFEGSNRDMYRPEAIVATSGKKVE